MFGIVSYPFDVIKTNRILQSAFSKEATENLPREFVALHERGAVQKGLMRGFLPYYAGIFAVPFVTQFLSSENLPASAYSLLAGTVVGSIIQQPLLALATHKQVIQNELAPRTYMDIAMKSHAKLMFAGVESLILRNLILMAGVTMTAEHNMRSDATAAMLAIGAITISHPFEVARVLSVAEGANISVLSSLFLAEGIAGLFRGYVPRTIQLFPALLMLNYASVQRQSVHPHIQDTFSAHANVPAMA